MAPPLGFRRSIAVEEDLREHDVGQWSGLTRAEISAAWPGAIEEWRSGRLAATPGGERRVGFVRRVTAAVNRLATDHEDGTLLVITHGGVIGALVRSLGVEAPRNAHLSGRWIQADRNGLVPGQVVALEAGSPPEEGEGSEYPAAEPARLRRRRE